MLFHKFIIPFFLLFSTVVLSQERIKHKVVQGESVYSIAKKYNVKPSEIFELNPKSKKTLSLNTVLTVPNNNYKAEEKNPSNAVVIHEVLPKETLYGISKKYKVTIDQIKAANPIIETEGLKLGTTITIPGASVSEVVEVTTPPTKIESVKEVKSVVKAEVKPKVDPVSAFHNQNEGEEIVHQVLPKETKYGISKRYKISIEELEKLNPGIVNGLSVGYQLVIRKGNKQELVENQIAQNQTKSQNQTKVQNQVKNQNQTTVSPQIEEEEEEVEAFPSSSQMKVVDIKESEMTPVSVAEPLSLENMSKADFLIAKASENLGARYRSGATGNGGFDCSGLMCATYKNIEMTLPRSSHEMAAGAGSRIDRSQAQKGDLIFFATMGKGRVSHVGMVTEVSEEGEIKFIHSSTSAGVIISSVNEPYYAKRFVQVNRVLVN